MLSELGSLDAWLSETPVHHSCVCTSQRSTFGLWCHEMRWAAFHLTLLPRAVAVKALGLQGAVCSASERPVSHGGYLPSPTGRALWASCSSMKALSLPRAFPIKGSWEFNCFWKTKQNSMFGTDTVVRWQSQAALEVPLPETPSISKSHLLLRPI